MNWISVKDRLPERYKEVLCLFRGNKGRGWKIDISWVDSTRFFLYEDLYGKVTHWMPLPEPPEDYHNGEDEPRS